MNPIHRRDVLRYGTLGTLLGGFQALLARKALADIDHGSTGSRKVLVVYLDGGADGLNVVYPHADARYPLVREALALNQGDGHPIGSSICELHPALAPVLPLFQDGDVALIQRVGRNSSTRSHFTERRVLQTAAADVDPEGVMGRFIDYTQPAEAVLSGCSLDTRPAVFLDSQTRSNPMIPELATYDLDGVPVGELPSPIESGSGLFGVYGSPSSFLGFTRAHRDGLALLQSVRIVEDLLPPDWPAGVTAPYPQTTFGHQVRDAIWTLLETECLIAAVRMGGYDTHANQANRLSNLLAELGQTLAAAREHATTIWSQLAILVVTEFGRNRTNTTGTDHGKAWCALALGGSIQGGAYNAQPDTWYQNGVSPIHAGNGSLDHRTDFRTLYADLFVNHLGLAAGELDFVIPGWSSLPFDANHPSQWDLLGVF